jgi:hypothetical protein
MEKWSTTRCSPRANQVSALASRVEECIDDEVFERFSDDKALTSTSPLHKQVPGYRRFGCENFYPRASRSRFAPYAPAPLGNLPRWWL